MSLCLYFIKSHKKTFWKVFNSNRYTCTISVFLYFSSLFFLLYFFFLYVSFFPPSLSLLISQFFLSLKKKKNNLSLPPEKEKEIERGGGENQKSIYTLVFIYWIFQNISILRINLKFQILYGRIEQEDYINISVD